VGIKRCDNNGDFLNGIRLKSEEGYLKKETEEAEKSLDETAANNVDMKCSSGQTLAGNGMFWGIWSSWLECPAGSAICGIKTRVQEYGGGFVDDTALNEVIVYCCDVRQ